MFILSISSVSVKVQCLRQKGVKTLTPSRLPEQPILLLKKNRQSLFLVLKETWICFNHQLSHRRPVLCLNILTPPSPHITCIFKIDPSKSSLLENCTPLRIPRPPRDVINDRSLMVSRIVTQVARESFGFAAFVVSVWENTT